MPCISSNVHYTFRASVGSPPPIFTGPTDDACDLTGVVSFTSGYGLQPPPDDPFTPGIVKVVVFTAATNVLMFESDYREDVAAVGTGDMWPYMFLEYATRDSSGNWSVPNFGSQTGGWTSFGGQLANQWNTGRLGNASPSPGDTPVLTNVTGIAIRLYQSDNIVAGTGDCTVSLRNIAVYVPSADNLSVVQLNLCPPAAPTGLTVGGVCAGTSVPLSWNPVIPADTYNIYRDSVLYVGSISGTSTTIVGQTVGVSRSWQVSAVCNGVEGPLSDAVSWTPCTACTPPDQPTGFTVSQDCEGAQVTLDWDAQPVDNQGNPITLNVHFWCGDQSVATILPYAGTTTGAVVILPCTDVGETCGIFLQAFSICGYSDPTDTALFTPRCPPCVWIATVTPCTSRWTPSPKPAGTWRKPCRC